MPIPRLIPDYTALLVVDIQEKLLPHIHNREQVVEQAGKLIDGAAALELPILVTEQYRKGLGRTVLDVRAKLDAAGRLVVCDAEKLKFSACVEAVREQMARHGVRCVVLCGIEAHVCVLQTALDLRDNGYMTAVALDAIGSRTQSDQAAAERRMIQAGVIPTTAESALFELVHEAGGERFKAVLPIVK